VIADGGIVNLILIPIGLGLLGFVEPCAMGSNLLFVQYLEGTDARAKLAQTAVYTLTRALFTGVLGAGAGFLGVIFLDAQKAAWLALGAAYVALGALYLLGKADVLMARLVPATRRASLKGSIGLGLLFGLNIPACAAPLLFAVLGAAAAGGHGSAAHGFLSLALFGLALSLPLLAAVALSPARRALDWLSGQARRLPVITGLVFLGLGLWSMYFGLFVTPRPAA
jgi:cytochrome c-type biogenesis protein